VHKSAEVGTGRLLDVFFDFFFLPCILVSRCPVSRFPPLPFTIWISLISHGFRFLGSGIRGFREFHGFRFLHFGFR